MTSLTRSSGRRPPLTRATAQRLFPEIPLEVIDALASIWDEVVHRIIDEMMGLTRTDQVLLHIDLREEMVLELAQLQLWLGEGVIKKRMTGRDPSVLNIEQERKECLGPQGAAAISHTARLAHERIWSKRLENRWKPKSDKAIERETKPRQATLAIKPVGKNHFIPRWFIRDNWARDGKVLRWRRGADGWSSAWRGFGKWGFRQNLYSDRLEAYFGLLEGDAKKPIEMLLDMKPMNGPQREAFVGFLIIQILRNPSFIDRLREGLIPKLAELGHIDDPAMLQKAYETLFGNNDMYRELAQPVMWSRWAVVKTRSPLIVLPDAFGAHGNFGDGLRMLAPLTPRACFVTLPSRETEKRIIPLLLTAEDRLARRISSILIASAANEFLSHPDFLPGQQTESVSIAGVLREIEVALEDPAVD